MNNPSSPKEECICKNAKKPSYHAHQDPHCWAFVWYCKVHGEQKSHTLIHETKKDYCKLCKNGCDCDFLSLSPREGWRELFGKLFPGLQSVGHKKIGNQYVAEAIKSFIEKEIERARKNTDYETYNEGFEFGMEQGRADKVEEVRLEIEKTRIRPSPVAHTEQGRNLAIDKILSLPSLKELKFK